MADQNSQYMAMLTAVGEAKLANATALGVNLNITQLGVGDANGVEPMPSRTQTALINERRRAPLNQLSIDPNNSAIIIAEQVIPEDIGGWWIREIGLYDEAGDLVAVANCPPTFKPELAQGSGRTQVVRLNILVSSTQNIQLKIDPSVVLATRAYADSLIVSHLAAADPHPQYTTEAEVAALVTAHSAAADPHPQYTTEAEVNALIAAIPPSTDGLAGTASALKASASGTNAAVSVSADAVCLKDNAGRQKVIGPLALAINSAAGGVNGLDTGALVASTWYSVWVIWNGATAAGLLSLSATAPTLPAGYTHKARVGWIRTDATANKYPLAFKQWGRSVRYVPGTNPANAPIMASGAAAESTPVAVGGFVPPTAGLIAGTVHAFAGQAAGASPVAFANAHAQYVFAQAPSGGSIVPPFLFGLMGDSIYWYSSGSSTLYCHGWEDNL